MWWNRLPSSYRRNYYVNVAIALALIALVSNLWRLGPRYATLAVLGLLVVALAYACIYPIVRLARAQPRPGRAAFVLASAYLAAFAYVVMSFFFRLPGSFIALFAGVVLMWVFFISYRGIVLPSLFDRTGRFGSRFREVRAAQRASREDLLAALRSARGDLSEMQSQSQTKSTDA